VSAAVYRASVSSYLTLAGPFAGIAAIWLASGLRSGEFVVTPIVICTGIALAFARWLSRFRLALGNDGFDYRAPGQARAVRYTDVLDYAATLTESPYRLHLRLTDGSVLPVNIKVLPRKAARELLARMPHAGPAS